MVFFMEKQVQVLVPVPLSEPFDYKVPEGMEVRLGDVVRVPFGKTEQRGVVWNLESRVQSSEFSKKKYELKEILEKLDAPAIPEKTLKFIDWVADYTLAPRGAVFAMVVSVKEALEEPKKVSGFRFRVSGHPPPSLPPQAGGGNSSFKMTKARQKVLDFLKEGGSFSAADIAREAGVGQKVIKDLAKFGILEEVELAIKELPQIKEEEQAPELSPAQDSAAKILRERVKSNEFSATVLEGVTGSGKTEVYFEAIKQAMEEGKQVLVLLPEIVLTAQLIDRFRKRFGFAPTEWHSGLTPAKRRKNWRAIARGQTQLIVGARSALFLPYPKLGLIIVDEEHEAAYKQEEGVIYHGRDMAVVRASIEKIPIILVSATPSLETMVNVYSKKYAHLHLPERHGAATIPIIETVDMRNQRLDAQHWLSKELRDAMLQVLENKEQILLFLNRRGYAPLTLCRHCGFRYKCNNCSAWLVKHKHANFLQCHHCGNKQDIVKECPECHTENSLAACGPGVERLEEEVRDLFPQARIVLMTSDTTASPKAAGEIIRSILENRVDIIIGTQLVTKGHHFPNLTLVGIIDADLGLEGGDLRAAEKTYQILHQVAGRAGRESKQGRAIVQSYMPDHNVMHALVKDDRDGFIQSETDSRRASHMPPFGRLASLIISGKNEAKVKQTALDLAQSAPRGPGIEVLGPAPAPLSLLRGNFRYRLLVKAERKINIQKMLRSWIGKPRLTAGIRLKVDVDPYSFM